ncbi:MAG: type I restriction-modification system subunit M N-terminal domain-containing protein, partial [Mediterranea sp.]|nr:type I restriction-modification system subunit M N-terminal domain-containing protein [Mediterranea sp.]
MTVTEQQQLGKALWSIANQLRGAMDADDFRDYMLSFLFLRYLSDNYEKGVKKELGADYPETSLDVLKNRGVNNGLQIWYEENADSIASFEMQMRRKIHYV